MRMKKVVCPKCKGTGETELPKRLLHVFNKFSPGIEITSEEMLIHINRLEGSELGRTSMNNRLEKLRKLGLLGRRQDGEFWKYFLA